MSVRRRAIRNRVQEAARHAAFMASLQHIKDVVDAAIAEGLTTMTQDELAARLKAPVTPQGDA